MQPPTSNHSADWSAPNYARSYRVSMSTFSQYTHSYIPISTVSTCTIHTLDMFMWTWGTQRNIPYINIPHTTHPTPHTCSVHSLVYIPSAGPSTRNASWGFGCGYEYCKLCLVGILNTIKSTCPCQLFVCPCYLTQPRQINHDLRLWCR